MEHIVPKLINKDCFVPSSYLCMEHIVPKLINKDCFVPSSYLLMEHIVPKLVIKDCFVPSSFLLMEHIVPKLVVSKQILDHFSTHSHFVPKLRWPLGMRQTIRRAQTCLGEFGGMSLS